LGLGAPDADQPDIVVLEGFDGPGSYTILEIKTCEPAGYTFIAHRHTATHRAGGAGRTDRFLEQTYSPGQYTLPAHQPGARRLRLLTFVVSVRGALGSEAQTFIRQISPGGGGSALPAACLLGERGERAGPHRVVLPSDL